MSLKKLKVTGHLHEGRSKQVVSEVDSTLAVELNITQGDKSNNSYSRLKRSRQVQIPRVCKKANSCVDCLLITVILWRLLVPICSDCRIWCCVLYCDFVRHIAYSHTSHDLFFLLRACQEKNMKSFHGVSNCHK